MYKRKILSILCAISMVISMSTASFAADGDELVPGSSSTQENPLVEPDISKPLMRSFLCEELCYMLI